MANFIGAIEAFNPYVQQIPTEAYTKVGLYKEHEYQAGVQKVQETIDQVAGLDVANEGGRQYLRARVDELTKSLNRYSAIDFSNVNNVSQLVSLAKPLYQDENIVNDVINTGVYRKWQKDASEAYKTGKMELGQFARESADVSSWLNSKSAGSQYTGRQAPNTATKKDLVDRVVKLKKDGIDMNEYVYDIKYSMDTPYYVKATNKYYSEADFNNFITESVMNDRDREMLMNEHWYENQGKPIEQLQMEDIDMYQNKINQNLKEIERIKNDPLLYAGDKKAESQRVIDDLSDYNRKLKDGKITFLQNLNLADPTSRDVFHRDLSESRFVSSLNILRNETKKEELQKNEQWFTDKQASIEASKNTTKGATGTGTGKAKTLEEQISEVALYTPVDANAPKTELSLNVIQSGWQLKNDEVNSAMNGLIGKLQENGVNMADFLATNSDGSLAWDQVNVGLKGGAAMSVPRFKNEASKQKFYNMVAGLNYAYTQEAADGHMDNKSFSTFIKNNYTQYRDTDPNSKFTLEDKIISDALNSLKGTTALMPKLEALFADKGVVRSLSQIDESLKNKKDMANTYREALIKSNALTADEIRNVKTITDDDLMNKSYILDLNKEKKRFGPDKLVGYRVHQETDGTYSIYQDVFDKDNDEGEDIVRSNRGGVRRPGFFTDYNPAEVGALESRKIVGGYEDERSASDDAYIGGSISSLKGISERSLDKAEKFVKQTYSYIQENLNSTAQNLKSDKDRYDAFKSGLQTFVSISLLQAGPQDIQVLGLGDVKGLTGIKDIEVNTFSIGNTEDIFNPNPMVQITFNATNTSDKDPKSIPYTANVSLRSFLATNPDYRSPGYAQYFAPLLYAQKDAYARIKATVNPLEGSEASYSNRRDIRPVFNYTTQQGGSGFAYDDMSDGGSGNQYQWETIPIEKDGKQTMVSYQVVSLGQNTNLGNIKTQDKQTYAPGAYYIKLKVPTSSGKPQTIFLKKPGGDSYAFNNASNAHYTIRELIFNAPEIAMDEINPQTNEVNYFTTDPKTIRGIMNSQLSYNGHSKIETIKLRDAIGKETQKQQITSGQTTYGR